MMNKSAITFPGRAPRYGYRGRFVGKKTRAGKMLDCLARTNTAADINTVIFITYVAICQLHEFALFIDHRAIPPECNGDHENDTCDEHYHFAATFSVPVSSQF
jgi:hypothetical protein